MNALGVFWDGQISVEENRRSARTLRTLGGPKQHHSA